MPAGKNGGAAIERLSADEIAEAERLTEQTTPGGRKRIDRTEISAPVKRAPVRVEENKLPSGRVLRTYQSPEAK